MTDLPLAAVPNQTFSVQLDERFYDITISECNGVMCITLIRDGETVVSGQRATAGVPVLPYRYQESGNFLFTVDSEELPYYTNFGVNQFLVYVSADELEAFRAV